MKLKISVLLTIGLILPLQFTVASPVEKYRSLSLQEKNTACTTVQSRIRSGFSLTCANGSANVFQAITEQANTTDTVTNQIELLLIERHMSDKNQRNQNDLRMADVYTYNYQTDTLSYSIINMTSGEVLQSEQKQYVQLPLTEAEINRSRNIAGNDQVLHGYLEEEYLKITGQPLQSMDQLVVKAFIFLAKSMPDVVNDRSTVCGLHRCARLVLHTAERIALETSPIIDLSSGVVTQYRTGN